MKVEMVLKGPEAKLSNSQSWISINFIDIHILFHIVIIGVKESADPNHGRIVATEFFGVGDMKGNSIRP